MSTIITDQADRHSHQHHGQTPPPISALSQEALQALQRRRDQAARDTKHAQSIAHLAAQDARNAMLRGDVAAMLRTAAAYHDASLRLNEAQWALAEIARTASAYQEASLRRDAANRTFAAVVREIEALVGAELEVA